MLRLPVRSIIQRKPVIFNDARHFWSWFSAGDEKLTIPTDAEQQSGRRKEEIDAAAKGKVRFNRDPIIPPSNAGTKQNPILVPSGLETRTVGYEDPVTHSLVWFNLDKGPLHYIPDIGLYFKLQPVDDE